MGNIYCFISVNSRSRREHIESLGIYRKSRRDLYRVMPQALHLYFFVLFLAVVIDEISFLLITPQLLSSFL